MRPPNANTTRTHDPAKAGPDEEPATTREQERRPFIPLPGTFELHERRGDFIAVFDGLTGRPLRVEPIDPEMRPFAPTPPPTKSQ